MKLSVEEIKSSQKKEYNNFLASSPKGHVLQTYEWGELKAETGWEPVRLLVRDGGKPVAAISLLKRKVPKINRCIFYAPRGPVADLQNEKLCDFLFQAVEKTAQCHKAVFLKIDPDIPVTNDEHIGDYLQSRGFREASTGQGFEGVQPRFVFRLDLTPGPEQLFKNLASKTRYNIRLARRRGVKVRECRRDELEVFYQILLETAQRDKFLVRSFQYFLDLWDLLVPPGFAKFFLAEYGDEVIAGTLALTLGSKAWYLYGASSNRHRNVMPNYLLQWEMIEWACSLGCTLYDFRGVPGDLSEDNPLYGLYRFKKGFQGEYTEFIGEFDLSYRAVEYRFWRWAEPIYGKLIRKMRGSSTDMAD